MRLYICGELVGEQVLTSLMTNGTNSDCARKISLFSVGGDGYSVQGFIHSAEVLPSNLSASYHYTKVVSCLCLLFFFNKRLLSCVSLFRFISFPGPTFMVIC
jgi:hypothetical protein